MSFDKVKQFFESQGAGDKVLWLEHSSATVELAAEAVGCEPARIAKSLSFEKGEGALLIIAAGDARIDNAKFKQQFGIKAKMLSAEKVEPLIGHGVGGVCPFGVNEGVDIYLDESLRRFETVYPAAGTSASAVHLSLAELERASEALGWVSVTK